MGVICVQPVIDLRALFWRIWSLLTFVGERGKSRQGMRILLRGGYTAYKGWILYPCPGPMSRRTRLLVSLGGGRFYLILF